MELVKYLPRRTEMLTDSFKKADSSDGQNGSKGLFELRFNESERIARRQEQQCKIGRSVRLPI